MMDPTQTTVRDVVAGDFRAAAIFQQHGLDFCCGGGRTIADACQAKGVAVDELSKQLEELTATPAAGVPQFNRWSPDLLVDYIVGNHHRYVRETGPTILAHAKKVARVHGDHHPETVRIAELFEGIARDLDQHMQKEEGILFPAIKGLAGVAPAGSRPFMPFGSVRNPIRMMEMEHQDAGDEMAEIRQLSSGFTPPEDACMTYRVLYQELHAFEQDLHQHVHLENNILFPKAVELEQQRATAVA